MKTNKKHRTPLDDLKSKFGDNIEVIDVSPAGNYRNLHPAFPMSNVKLPNSSREFTSSAQGIYEGLRIFENEGISPTVITCDTMKIHRSVTKKTGEFVGYKFGLVGRSS